MKNKQRVNTKDKRQKIMANEKKVTKVAEKSKMGFPIPKENYFLLAIGFVIVVIGFLLMIGGNNNDPDKFNYEMFSFRRITLAPIVVLVGFAFSGWAIMRKPKVSDEVK